MATDQKPKTAQASNSSGDAGARLPQEVQDAHERRTTVPGADNVDARLDNRTGADRPKLESFPAKPQQVDGPDVMHQVEHTRATLGQDALGRDLKDTKEVGERKGMFSPGPHGLSEDVDGRPLKAN